VVIAMFAGPVLLVGARRFPRNLGSSMPETNGGFIALSLRFY
jgi:hypothetical protein